MADFTVLAAELPAGPSQAGIALRAAGATLAATVAVSAIRPLVPVGTATGDLSVLQVVVKPYNVSITTPTGWTKIAEATNGTVAASGADLGSTKVAMYVRESAPVGAIPAIVFTGVAANTADAVINSYSKTAGVWDYVGFTTGGDSTNGANYSATGASGLNVEANNWVIGMVGVNGDVASGGISAITIGGMTGATFGTRATRQNHAVTTGYDCRLIVADIPCTAGTSNVAPTFTYTNTSSGSGTSIWLRLAAVLPDSTGGTDGAQPSVVATETWTGTDGAAWPSVPNTWAFTGQAGTLNAQRGQLVAAGGAYVSAHADLTNVSLADCQVSVDFTLPGTLSEDYCAVGLRSNGTYVGFVQTAGYLLYINCGSTAGTVDLRRGDATGSGVSIATVSAQTLVGGGTYRAVIQAIGSTIKGRVWKIAPPTAEADPGWEVQATDTTFAAAGYPSLSASNGSTTTNATWFDNLEVVQYTTGPVTWTADLTADGTVAEGGTLSGPSNLTTVTAAVSATGVANISRASTELAVTASVNANAGNARASGSNTLAVTAGLSSYGYAAWKMLDTANNIPNQAWFATQYARGYRLFCYHTTQWGTELPGANTETYFGWALAEGFTIAAYTREPNYWAAGIAACGQYKDRLQFFCLDVETDPGTPVTQEMVDGVRALGVRPLIYSGWGMYAAVMGGNVTTFQNEILWDTDTSVFNEATWVSNTNVPTPVAYGGWNTAANPRTIIQQQFEVTLGGVAVDLNSIRADRIINFTNLHSTATLTANGTVSTSGNYSKASDPLVVTAGTSAAGRAEISGSSTALGLTAATSADGHVGVASASTAVTVTVTLEAVGAAGYQYRAYDLTPPTDVAETDGAVSLGLEFYVTAEAALTHIGFWQGSTGSPSTADRTVALYQVTDASSGTLVGVTETLPVSGSGWQSKTLDTPRVLTPNTRYRAVILHPGGGYAASTQWFTTGTGSADLVVGVLHVPSAANATGNQQASFVYGGSIGYPAGTWQGANYWIDITVDSGTVVTDFLGDSTPIAAIANPLSTGRVDAISGSPTTEVTAAVSADGHVNLSGASTALAVTAGRPGVGTADIARASTALTVTATSTAQSGAWAPLAVTGTVSAGGTTDVSRASTALGVTSTVTAGGRAEIAGPSTALTVTVTPTAQLGAKSTAVVVTATTSAEGVLNIPKASSALSVTVGRTAQGGAPSTGTTVTAATSAAGVLTGLLSGSDALTVTAGRTAVVASSGASTQLSVSATGSADGRAAYQSGSIMLVTTVSVSATGGAVTTRTFLVEGFVTR